MSEDALHEFSAFFNRPMDEVAEYYDSFIEKGIIYSPAKSAEEFFALKHPVRFAHIGPTSSEGQSMVSLGPFALTRESYEKTYSKLSKQFGRVEVSIVLGFKRLQYEKLGAMWTEDEAQDKYIIRAEEKSFIQFCSLMRFWNINNPDIREDFVWIKPNKKCKSFAERITGKKFAKNNYSWWQGLIDFEEGLISPTPKDYADRYIFSPKQITGPWERYLPNTVIWVLTHLYSEKTLGLKYTSFSNLESLLKIISNGLKEAVEGLLETPYEADRSLLIKELYDFNDLPFPVDAYTTFDYLCRTGFIIINRDGLRVEYSLATEIPDPKSVLKFPESWEHRVQEFVTTGSAIFSYLDLDEILAE